jgi:hypothetical protein
VIASAFGTQPHQTVPMGQSPASALGTARTFLLPTETSLSTAQIPREAVQATRPVGEGGIGGYFKNIWQIYNVKFLL